MLTTMQHLASFSETLALEVGNIVESESRDKSACWHQTSEEAGATIISVFLCSCFIFLYESLVDSNLWMSAMRSHQCDESCFVSNNSSRRLTYKSPFNVFHIEEHINLIIPSSRRLMLS